MYTLYVYVEVILLRVMWSVCSDPVFEPRPSLQLAVEYIVRECVRKYPQEKCPVCDVTALLRDPQVSRVCAIIHVYIRVLMRDEKEGRKKQTNNKAK